MEQDSEHPTGVATEPGEKENSPGILRARDRKANAALQLKIAGAEWHEIAEVVGYPTARSALVAVEKALEKELRQHSQPQLRALAGRRLERLLRASWPKAVNPEHEEHLPAMARAQSIVMDHAKLFGYVAPQEHVVHTPTMSELDAWVTRVVKHEVPELEEGNIFDAEVLHEDEEAL